MSNLQSVFTEYKKISEAPTFLQLKKKAKNDEHLQELIEVEKITKYKAIDNQGNIYAVENPALLSYQIYMGAKFATRKAPELLCAAKEIKKSKIWE